MPALSRTDGRKLVAIGLFWGSATFLLNDSVLVDDFARGLWVGVGLGVEILGLVLMARQRRGGRGRPGVCRSHPLAD